MGESCVHFSEYEGEIVQYTSKRLNFEIKGINPNVVFTLNI